ncbi:hypothetical protein [Bacillus sp. UNCCL13]|uniref:hypothetical protein n=1 Tax=Bacillus sp. UNCCL13 TaxID=1502772 RepID=UPI001C3159EB|nr:hypothetical protein [Bacillus sp. UNCCL13]
MPKCFKEETSVVRHQPGGIRRYFDKPPPRQLILIMISPGALSYSVNVYPPF